MYKRQDHNEFGYLVLYFNLALNRYQSRIKKRLILVSGYGRPEMIMTLNTLNENFKGFIDDIVTCDVIELENFSFQHNDIVITTIPIMPSSKVPVVYIQGKVEFYYHEILSLLKSEYDINCSIRKYLLPCLLYTSGCKKRRVMKCINSIKESHLLLFDNGSYNDPTWYNCCSNAVSYTHLDVYKRQVTYRRLLSKLSINS